MERRFEAILSSPFWLVLIVAILVGSPVVALGEAAAADARNRSGRAESAAVALATQRAATAIAERIRVVKEQVAVLTQPSLTGKATPFSAALQAGDAVSLQAQLASFRSLIDLELPRQAFVDSFVLDPRNLTVAAEPFARTSIGVDRSDRPFANGASQAEATKVTPPFRGRSAVSGASDGDVLVAVIGRMLEPVTRRALGSLVLIVVTRVLSDPIQVLRPAASEVYVVDQGGRLIVRASRNFSPDPETFTDLSARPLVAAALRGTLPDGPLEDPFGAGPRLASSAVVPDLEWRVIAVTEPSLASRELESTLAGQRIVRLILVLLLLVATYLLARTVRRTIRHRRALARANVEIARADEAKSQFLANMSHELRTPLNAIIGFADVLGQRMFGELNEKQADYVADIVGSGRHLLALINDILDLSKVEAGQMKLDRSTFSLSQALAQGVTMVRERAAGHGIAISLEIPPDVDLIDADERKIRQVMFNLLSNAVKFTPDGGQITVSAARDDREVRIAVADTGVGIAPEDQERVFKKFEQTDTGRRQEASSGLGLALAKSLVELHGGRIWLESQLGIGTTFTVALPQVTAPAS